MIGDQDYSLPTGVAPTMVVNERTESIADPVMVAALWTVFTEEKATQDFPEKNNENAEDVGIEVGGMSRDGKLNIGFNQPLMVPPFE